MKVAVAVIVNRYNQVLITKRPFQASHGGLWEFPGGKVQPNEEVICALKREIQEEVGLVIEQPQFLCEINHTYARHDVNLHVYHVQHFQGEAKACESQLDLRWVEFNDLNDYDFPEANQAILRKLVSFQRSV